jgi:hemoglobin
MSKLAAGLARTALVLVVALLAACAALPRPSLYDELGGQAGIERLASALIVESKADPRIADLFAETDVDYFRDRLEEQLCEIAGGPCEYTGLPMSDAHSGMDISEREFNWFVEDLERAMRSIGLSLSTQNRLLARLARMHEDVIHQ